MKKKSIPPSLYRPKLETQYGLLEKDNQIKSLALANEVSQKNVNDKGRSGYWYPHHYCRLNRVMETKATKNQDQGRAQRQQLLPG